MPSGTICDRTVLLTPRGWIRCGLLESEAELIGLDRAGSPFMSRVLIARDGAESRVGVVGTAAAVGEFIRDSRLLMGAGDATDLGQVVATSSIADLQFETFRLDAKPRHDVQAAEAIWRELQSMSVLDNADCVAIKCVSDEQGLTRDTGASWLKVCGDAEGQYCVVVRKDFLGGFCADPDAAILAIANACAYRVADARWEVETDAVLFIMWLLDALKRTGIKRVVAYDSMQHTCFLFVEAAASNPPPLGPGRCAFWSSRSSRKAMIEWEDPSWTPVVSGFLLASEAG